MRFSVDPNSRSPIYRQLEDQVRYAIAVGDLGAGDPLPSIREAEQRLGINRNTVRRAYQQLHAEGLVVLRQGREARVAPRPQGLSESKADRARAVRRLAAAVLQRCEGQGLDGVQFARHLAEAAARHDGAHPRCAFLECSGRQAGWLAGRAQELLARRVIGVDLHDLRGGAGSLPASIRVAMTPAWHLGEVRELLAGSPVRVFQVRVHLGADCVTSLRSLRGEAVGLVVRDAESASGFGQMLAEHTGAEPLATVLADDMTAVAALARKVSALVYTSPCDEAVRHAAGAQGLRAVELVFDPSPEDVRELEKAAFPVLGAASVG